MILVFVVPVDVAPFGACPHPVLPPCGKLDTEAAPSPAGPESSIVPLAPTPLSGDPLEPVPLPPTPLPPMPLLGTVPLPATAPLEPLAAPALAPEP